MSQKRDTTRLPEPAIKVTRTMYLREAVLVAMLLSGMGLSWLTFRFLSQQVAKESRSEFLQSAASCFQTVEGIFRQYECDLHNVKTFFECSEMVSRQEFRDFTEPLLENHAGLEAICWIPLVTAEQRPLYEARALQEGLAEYRLSCGLSRQLVVPLSECGVFYPVYYLEPMKGNEFLLGRNFSSHSEWLSVLQRTADSGLPAVRIDPVLLTEKSGLCAMLLYPVYAKQEQTDRGVKGRLQGFVGAVLLPQQDLNAQIGASGELTIRLSHFQKDVESRRLFAPDQAQPSDSLHYLRKEFAFGDQHFLVEAMLVKHTLPILYVLMPWMVLLAGSAMSVLLVLYVYSVQRRNERTEQIVIGRTLELTKEQEKCRQLAEKAVSNSQAKSEFLAGMSHEIRTPMNAIIGFSEILAEEKLASLHHEYVNTIHDSAQTLMVLINDILDLSKIEAGRMEIEWADCSIRELLGHIETLLRPQAQRKDIDFEIRTGPELPDLLRIDPMRVRQCLMNLVGNAIKFTECGYVYVDVSCGNQSGQLWLNIAIADTGIGIEDDRQEMIFDAFTQADASTGRLSGGTGLGLAITQRLAQLMGGTVSVESAPSKGSVFTLMLPVKAVDLEAELCGANY